MIRDKALHVPWRLTDVLQDKMNRASTRRAKTFGCHDLLDRPQSALYRRAPVLSPPLKVVMSSRCFLLINRQSQVQGPVSRCRVSSSALLKS